MVTPLASTPELRAQALQTNLIVEDLLVLREKATLEEPQNLPSELQEVKESCTVVSPNAKAVI